MKRILLPTLVVLAAALAAAGRRFRPRRRAGRRVHQPVDVQLPGEPLPGDLPGHRATRAGSGRPQEPVLTSAATATSWPSPSRSRARRRPDRLLQRAASAGPPQVRLAVAAPRRHAQDAAEPPAPAPVRRSIERGRLLRLQPDVRAQGAAAGAQGQHRRRHRRPPGRPRSPPTSRGRTGGGRRALKGKLRQRRQRSPPFAHRGACARSSASAAPTSARGCSTPPRTSRTRRRPPTTTVDGEHAPCGAAASFAGLASAVASGRDHRGVDLHGRLPRVRRRPADRVAHLVLPAARRRRRLARGGRRRGRGPGPPPGNDGPGGDGIRLPARALAPRPRARPRTTPGRARRAAGAVPSRRCLRRCRRGCDRPALAGAHAPLALAADRFHLMGGADRLRARRTSPWTSTKHVVAPHGEIDALTAPRLGSRLLELAEEGKRTCSWSTCRT